MPTLVLNFVASLSVIFDFLVHTWITYLNSEGAATHNATFAQVHYLRSLGLSEPEIDKFLTTYNVDSSWSINFINIIYSAHS